MNSAKLDRLNAIHKQCNRELKNLEFWPGYYDRRMSEFITYLSLMPDSSFGNVLEVGCGNGFYAALLSVLSEQVVATDLDNSSIPIHAQGLAQARKMVATLGISNVRIEPASVDQLPMADASFDLVFSSHVMVYVPQAKRAISEIQRVLKPGGYHFCIVPARMAAVHRLIQFQTYMMERAFHHLLILPIQKKLSPSKRDGTENPASHAGSRKRMLKDFPFPPTFGGLPRWKDEFHEWTPARWAALITDNGEIPLVSQSTTQVNPLLPWVGDIRADWAGWIHDKTRKFELRHGGKSFFQSLGGNSVIVTRKSLSRGSRK